jgi:hypothetical protein
MHPDFMTDPMDQMRKMLDLAMRREQAKMLAIKRFSAIVVNSPRDQWDTLIDAEIANANVAQDVQDAFVKQLRDALDNYKRVYEDAQRFLRDQAKRKGDM